MATEKMGVMKGGNCGLRKPSLKLVPGSLIGIYTALNYMTPWFINRAKYIAPFFFRKDREFKPYYLKENVKGN